MQLLPHNNWKQIPYNTNVENNSSLEFEVYI